MKTNIPSIHVLKYMHNIEVIKTVLKLLLLPHIAILFLSVKVVNCHFH